MAPFLLAFVCLLAATANAAPPPIALREVASGLNAPTEIVNAGDGSGRLFIVEQGGLIRVLKDGAILPTPFLDLSALTVASGERGLLGLAFHPQYLSNRRFFVYYTQRGNGALRISSFLASSGNPDRADASSEQEILTIAHPDFSNHNGGHLAFGPEGYLYIGTGDGGSGGDPSNHAQSLSELLGKLLRIDIDVTPYRIPSDNPFVGTAGARGEIWAYGLRNPWKFTFDRATHDLYIADVGQGTTEEVNFIARGTPSGLNFGWRVFEGTSCFNSAAGCTLANHTPPVLQYFHDSSGGISITGGYVYRGFKSAALRGYYFYGDFGSNRVWAAIREGSTWSTTLVIAPSGVLSGVSTFGEDEAGEIYVASYDSGHLFAIEGPGPGINPAIRFETPAGPCRYTASVGATGNPLQRQATDCRAWRAAP